jgi:L-ascorbate metabolism protein UlaG (beta-lactamase superfamily)
MKLIFSTLFLLFAVQMLAQNKLEEDVVKTSKGDLKITFIGHGTLMFTFAGKIIHVDPVSMFDSAYNVLPKADAIFVTHDHYDHLDLKIIDKIKKPETKLYLTQICSDKIKQGTVVKNGETIDFEGIKVEVVPAYNIVHKRNSEQVFHPKGDGNGYIFTFGKTRVYVAGDTENTPEMKELRKIYIAFLPMNLPYTMTPEMVADATKAFKPKILYPYHFGKTKTADLLELMKSEKGIEIRVRKME